jgi:hypothetical protein
MENQSALEKMNRDYPFVRYIGCCNRAIYHSILCSMNCIVNHYTPWTDDTMIAIAEDRFEGLEQEVNIPIRCLLPLSPDSSQEHLKDLLAPSPRLPGCLRKHTIIPGAHSARPSTAQYLEFVALFPEMYRDVKGQLLQTRDSLRIGAALLPPSHLPRRDRADPEGAVTHRPAEQ